MPALCAARCNANSYLSLQLRFLWRRPRAIGAQAK